MTAIEHTPSPKMSAAASIPAPILQVSNLQIAYSGSLECAVNDVSFELNAGEVLSLVGESGSGKSTAALSILRLLPENATIINGSVLFQSNELVGLSNKKLHKLRGRMIGFIPQDPTVSLDPTQQIGKQIAEVFTIHKRTSRAEALERAVEILEKIGLDDPRRRARQYPHEFSGGMRQRVLIGIAWACNPQLIIADEPTSALDVTVQQQVLDQLEQLRQEFNTALLLITHDLGVAAERADKIIVMSEGKIVEQGSPDQVLESPQEEYTKRLINSLPNRRPRRHVNNLNKQVGEPLVEVQKLVKEFNVRGVNGKTQRFRAVNGIDFTIECGETLGLVGESGSGKTTTAQMVMALQKPTSGQILFEGQDLTKLVPEKLRLLRQRLQIIPQNPYASLSPKFTLFQIIEEPLLAFKIGSRKSRRARAQELLEQVGIPKSYGTRRAAELSGGQRQRIAIARALALRPQLVVCDEPVSALDVTVQAQVLDLLADLQKELNLSYLFISHDLAVVQAIADRIIVMQKGTIVESGAVTDVFEHPQSAYTKQLLEAVPGIIKVSDTDGVRV